MTRKISVPSRILFFTAMIVLLAPNAFDSEMLFAQWGDADNVPRLQDQRLRNRYSEIDRLIREEKWARTVSELNGYAQRALNLTVKRPDQALYAYLQKIEIAHTADGRTAPREDWIRSATRDAMQLLAQGGNQRAVDALIVALTVAEAAIQQDTGERPFEKIVRQLDMVADFLSDLGNVTDDSGRERQRERSEAVYRRMLIASLGEMGEDGKLASVTTKLEEHVVRLAEIVEDADEDEREAQLAAIDSYVVGVANLTRIGEWSAAIDTAVAVNERLYAEDDARRIRNFRGFCEGLADRMVALGQNDEFVHELLTSSLLDVAERGYTDDANEHVELLSRVYRIGESLTGWDRVAARRIELLEETAGQTSPEVVEAMLEFADYRWRKMPLVADLDVAETPAGDAPIARGLTEQAECLGEYYADISGRAKQAEQAEESWQFTSHERAAACYVLAQRIDEAGDQIEQARAVAEDLDLPDGRQRELAYQAGYIRLRAGETAAARTHFQDLADTRWFDIDKLTLEGVAMIANCALIEEDYVTAYEEASRAIALFDQTPEGKDRPLSDASILAQLQRYETLQTVVTLAENAGQLGPEMKSRLQVLIDTREFIIRALTQRVHAGQLPLTDQQVRTGQHQILFNQRQDLVDQITMLAVGDTQRDLPAGVLAEVRSEQLYLKRVIASENARRAQQAALDALWEAQHAVRDYKHDWYNGGGARYFGPVNVFDWNGKRYLID